MVQIQIHIADALHIRKRLIRKQIVNIKRMLGQLHAGSSQDVRAEHQRVHDQVLGRLKPPDIIPCAHFFLREDIPVIHHPALPLIQMVVHIITYKKIRYLLPGIPVSVRAEIFYLLKEFQVRLPIQPVIGIHHFIIDPPRQFQTFVYPGAVAAVFLMNRPHDVRIL